MDLQAELDIATAAAEEAGSLLLARFRTAAAQGRPKGVQDVVTEADVASERHIAERLAMAFPHDGLVAEEGSRGRSLTARRWLVDPLDGTVNYSRGVPIWCVSIALFEGSRPILGVIHDPVCGETFQAVEGQGAHASGNVLATSSVRHPSRALVHITVDYGGGTLAGLEELNALAPKIFRPRHLGSVALALAYVATGRFDAVVHRFASPWDYGAGVLLVQEAGGAVSDLTGAPYTDQTVAVVAAGTDSLHRELLDALSEPAARE
jgi:myo-inositol-1(or 4)-monophosphatase